MNKEALRVIILFLVSLLLYFGAYVFLVPIIGFKGVLGLLLFCMAYKLSTT